MHLDGRWESEPLPWDYREEVLMRLKDTDMLLDMDTGDGGFLLSLRHPYELTCATESDERDYEKLRGAACPPWHTDNVLQRGRRRTAV